MQNKRSRVYWAKVGVIALSVPLVIYAFSSGPLPGHAGVPGESTCVACHTGTLNSGPGSVTVAFPGELTYTPGATQRLAVTVADPNQRRWGFQLTARSAADANVQAGSFAPANDQTQVLCSAPPFTSQAPAPCPATAPLQYIEHTRNAYQASVSRFEFDWTAPATDIGPVVIYVAGNAANGDGSNGGDRIYTKTYTLTPAAGGGGGGQRPSITANGIVNGASFQPGIAAGSWVTILGSNLSTTTRTWRTDEIVNGVLPTELDGVSVTINGKRAAVYYINPGQINVQAPSDDAEGDVPVVVTNSNGASAAMMGRLQRFSPACFQWPGNYAIATRQDFSWVAKPGLFPGVETRPARPGDIIILWGTGFGPTNPAVPAGKNVEGAPTVVENPTVRINNVTAEFLGGALSPGSVGLYQIVVRVPESTPDGDVPITAEFGSFRSPDNVRITVQR